MDRLTNYKHMSTSYHASTSQPDSDLARSPGQLAALGGRPPTPNLLSKEEWEELNRSYWTQTKRTHDIHHMVQYYFGLRDPRRLPLMDLYDLCNGEMKNALDHIVHMDFLVTANDLKQGLDWEDCPSALRWTGHRHYFTIFYSPDDVLLSSYEPYYFGLRKPRRLQRCIPTEDRIKFMKDLTDLEEIVKMCRNRLQPIMTSCSGGACEICRRIPSVFDCALPKIETCKSIISTLP